MLASFSAGMLKLYKRPAVWVLLLVALVLSQVFNYLVPYAGYLSADNERAAEYLRTRIGPTDAYVEWVVVRPDSLVDQRLVTEYELHPSPTRSAIFDPGRTSRINVAHFMAELIAEDTTWTMWKGRMPVIYNSGASA
jgi:hypothetical protein